MFEPIVPFRSSPKLSIRADQDICNIVPGLRLPVSAQQRRSGLRLGRGRLRVHFQRRADHRKLTQREDFLARFTYSNVVLSPVPMLRLDLRTSGGWLVPR